MIILLILLKTAKKLSPWQAGKAELKSEFFRSFGKTSVVSRSCNASGRDELFFSLDQKRTKPRIESEFMLRGLVHFCLRPWSGPS
jgi:hypothetical protein